MDPKTFLILIAFTITTFHLQLTRCNNQFPIEASLNLLGGELITKCFNPNATATTDALSNIDDVSKILLDGSKFFAIKMLQTLNLFEPKSISKGLIFSPSSIWSTLMVTYLGSEGETEQELMNKLKLQQLSKSSVALAYKSIKWWKELKSLKIVTNKTDNTLVSSANKLYIDDHLDINDCFKTVFADEIEMKSFSSRPTQCLEEINNWVSDQTKGKINNLLVPGSITPMTKIMIVNAIYFKSFWAQQFDSTKTRKHKFYVSLAEEMNTEMMIMDSASVTYGISEELRASAVEIPYSNPDFSMVIILPDETRSLDSLIRELSLVKLQELLDNMYDDEVTLMIPKFKSEQELELAGALFSLGIRKLFDPRYVNLSLIFNSSINHNHNNQNNDGYKIALDSVIHKSYISVNEEGTEAAAATAMIFARSGRPAFPTQFIANRPFLYMIRDVSTNLILFLGTVRRPSM